MHRALQIVPRPVTVEPGEGTFTLDDKTRILADAGLEDVAGLLAERLRAATGLPFPVSAGTGGPNAIRLTAEGAPSDLGDEGYELTATPEGVTIRALKPAGAFYGAQTLRQLLPPEVESAERVDGVAWTVPAALIIDAPRFPWRGYMLDSCRHMQSVEFIKRTLDRMAFHKLNVFHWHLTEDQGWRIEIDSYPRLTEVGAFRTGEGGQPYPEGQRYGGFYTKAEIREVVAYAAERFITVVPEVDMPGHMLAAIASYPELACVPAEYGVRTEWGICHDILCGGKPEVYEFVENVLSEVLDLFPSEVIHIGGDEAPKERWQECPLCQEKIRAEGLDDEEALQNYFTRHVMRFLQERGRRLMGWNEIMAGGKLPEEVIVHQWNWESAAAAAAKDGNDVVVSWYRWHYFDFNEAVTPIKRVYEGEPVPEGLTPDEERHILGAQANMWTEFRNTEDEVDAFTWPRLAALAEVDWSPRDARNWDDFQARLSGAHCERLARSGMAGAVQPATTGGPNYLPPE